MAVGFVLLSIIEHCLSVSNESPSSDNRVFKGYALLNMGLSLLPFIVRCMLLQGGGVVAIQQE